MVTDAPPLSSPIAIYLYEAGAGGLDRVAILLANGMASRGLQVELWLGRSGGALQELISEKVLVRTVGAPKLQRRGLTLFLQIPAIARMISLHRPAIRAICRSASLPLCRIPAKPA